MKLESVDNCSLFVAKTRHQDTYRDTTFSTSVLFFGAAIIDRNRLFRQNKTPRHLKVHKVLKSLCLRLRWLLRNRSNRCNRIQSIYENFLKTAGLVSWCLVAHPFGSLEVQNGVMG